MRNRILKHYPSSKIKVYAIWFAMFPGDARSKWRDRLQDRRVIHLWDEDKKVGRLYAEHIQQLEGYHGKVIWDAYFLYDSEAKWELTLPPIVSWGSPITLASRRLRNGIARVLKV